MLIIYSNCEKKAIIKPVNKIVLIGAGGHSRSCIEIIEENNDLKIEAIVDTFTKDKIFEGYKVINNENELKDIYKNIDNAFICIGFTYKKNLIIRENIYKNLKKICFKIPIIQSKHSYVSKKTKIGDGTIIMHNSFVNSNVSIGNNVILNTGSIIEHDSNIGDNCHISTGVIINGTCNVGKNSFIGSGSVLPNNYNVKPNSFKKALKLITDLT